MTKNIVIGILAVVVIYLGYVLVGLSIGEKIVQVEPPKTYTYTNTKYGFSVELPEHIKELKDEKWNDGKLRLASDSDDGHIEVELVKGGLKEMSWNPWTDSIETIEKGLASENPIVIIRKIDRTNGSDEMVYDYAFTTNPFEKDSIEPNLEQTVLVFRKVVLGDDLSRYGPLKNPELVLKSYELDDIARSVKIIK